MLTKMRALNRVVVTGAGGIGPHGKLEQTWQAVLRGESVIKPQTFEITIPTKVSHRGRVEEREVLRTEEYLVAPLPEGWDSELTGRDKSRTDVNGQLLVIAVGQALQSALLAEADRTGIGIITGTNLVFTNYIVEQMETYLHSGTGDVLMAAKIMVNNAAGYTALKYKLGGPNFAVSSACASGSMAVGEAFRKVQYGDANIILAAGVEGADHPSNIYAFDKAGAYSKSIEKGSKASRPGSASRDGFVMGNGCTVLVVESLKSALDRGVQILGEIIGYGSTNDANSLYDPPDDGNGLGRAIKRCLEEARLYKMFITIVNVAYYNGHMTGTVQGDKAEINALRWALGEDFAQRLLMSFTKSTTGHQLGNAGALEAFICLKALQEGIAPPTINLEDPDPMLEGFQVVAGKARRVPNLRYAISTSAGFGGHNACLAFESWSGQ